MHILVVGLNYRTAPVEIREQFTFDAVLLPKALEDLKKTTSILECVIVTTCNRTEIYAVVDRENLCGHYIRNFMEKWFRMPREQFTPYLYIYERQQAIEHLFRVTCGLDSMVIGETQILGQVKDAFSMAMAAHTTGSLFNRLFKQAVTLAKQAHAQTAISENPVSVSYAAVELAKRIFGSFTDKTVLIIGAGKMSELTAKHLHANHVKQIIVTNRTLDRAIELADKFQGKASVFTQLLADIAVADIVISSTGSVETVLTKDQVLSILPKRKSRPLFMIDIAVPRDLDPGISELANVFLYNIDDLAALVDHNLAIRQTEAAKIEAMITDELQAYEQWYKTLGAAPIIQALQMKTNRIHENTMDSLLKRLPDLDEREIKIIRMLTKSMVNQMLRDPIVQVKEISAERHANVILKQFSQIFALDEWLCEPSEQRIAAEQRPLKILSGSQALLNS